jgi:predicted 3-demethylubiquinone-9 3-methyltransferase (glyoxalase superfamily)
MATPDVRPFLWIGEKAMEAAAFYAAMFDDAEIGAIRHLPAGEVTCDLVELRIGPTTYILMNAPGAPIPNETFSFSVICKNQEEVDWYWDLLSVGGEPMACGWIRDRFGICWQITPARMQELTDSGTRAQRNAVMDAMMGMVKFDIAELEAAFESAVSQG